MGRTVADGKAVSPLELGRVLYIAYLVNELNQVFGVSWVNCQSQSANPTSIRIEHSLAATFN